MQMDAMNQTHVPLPQQWVTRNQQHLGAVAQLHLASPPPRRRTQLVFFQKIEEEKKKRQSKHLGLCLGRKQPQPTQMEFILRSVIQSIQAQDVAGRAEPKNASLKQLNVMLCIQLSLGLAEARSFHVFLQFLL